MMIFVYEFTHNQNGKRTPRIKVYTTYSVFFSMASTQEKLTAAFLTSALENKEFLPDLTFTQYEFSVHLA